MTALFEIGDLVRVENFNVDDAETDPNGFAGIISDVHVYLHNTEVTEVGEVVYTVWLPVAWAEGKHSWTFEESELFLLEPVQGF